MVEPKTIDTEIKNQMSSIIDYLRFGTAEISPCCATTIIMKRKGSNSLQISALALAHLAKNGLVKRNGKQLALTGAAVNLDRKP
jgi:hypothetical protein